MATIPPALLTRLIDHRRHHGVAPQIRPLAHTFAQQVLGLLFPHFASATATVDTLGDEVTLLLETLAKLEHAIASTQQRMPAHVAERFLEALPAVHELLDDDARAIFEGDPAARSVDEVILTYPGFAAIAIYRVANVLHQVGVPLLPRLLTEYVHEKTGIDIHPGATIGRRFCIDHGTGIVIGETTVIGDDVKLYQGVTLGALTVEKSLANSKRHPTIEHDCVIYAGATILGGTTVVGHHTVIAGNAFVTRSAPPNSVVTRQSEVRPRRTGESDAQALEEFDFVI
jgi:serine O-acetyltransferase